MVLTLFNDLELTGRTRTHVSQYLAPRFAAHPEVAVAFLDMREGARNSGIDLTPFSSFRDFETQQGFRPEKHQACFHGILSFYPGENPEDN